MYQLQSKLFIDYAITFPLTKQWLQNIGSHVNITDLITSCLHFSQTDNDPVAIWGVPMEANIQIYSDCKFIIPLFFFFTFTAHMVE